MQAGGKDCDATFDYFVPAQEEKVHFSNIQHGQGTVYYWEFDDGTTANIPNPAHDYSTTGYYKVSLSIYSKITNCLDYYEQMVLVGSAGSDLEADFTYNIIDNKVMFFDASKGDVDSYSWNFGESSALETVQNPEYQYSASGFYNVCLSVFDADGVQNMFCREIYIAPDSGEDTDCNADFTYCIEGDDLTAIFVDNSTGEPVEWLWNFGDKQKTDESSTSEVQHPTFTYISEGYYWAELRIENSNRSQSEKYKLINIDVNSQKLKAGLEAENEKEKDKSGGYPVQMFGAAFGGATKYVWDFGDGERDSSTTSPKHVYEQTGTYTICLTVSDPKTGLSDTECLDFVVEDPLEINEQQNEHLSLMCSPNPVVGNSLITFEVANESSTQLAVFDLSGRKVKTLINKEMLSGRQVVQLQTGDLVPGAYFIRLKTSVGEKTIKVIVA